MKRKSFKICLKFLCFSYFASVHEQVGGEDWQLACSASSCFCHYEQLCMLTDINVHRALSFQLINTTLQNSVSCCFVLFSSDNFVCEQLYTVYTVAFFIVVMATEFELLPGHSFLLVNRFCVPLGEPVAHLRFVLHQQTRGDWRTFWLWQTNLQLQRLVCFIGNSVLKEIPCIFLSLQLISVIRAGLTMFFTLHPFSSKSLEEDSSFQADGSDCIARTLHLGRVVTPQLHTCVVLRTALLISNYIV